MESCAESCELRAARAAAEAPRRQRRAFVRVAALDEVGHFGGTVQPSSHAELRELELVAVAQAFATSMALLVAAMESGIVGVVIAGSGRNVRQGFDGRCGSNGIGGARAARRRVVARRLVYGAADRRSCAGVPRAAS
jgi:hypothetical protein